MPAGAPVARDFEVLARLPYAQEHHTYFMVELEAPLGERAAAWTERLPAGVQLLHALPDRALFSAAGREVPAAALADAFPRTATVHPLAPHPFRPARARRFPAGVAAKRDAIADLIAKVSADEIEKYVTYLTGEDGVSPLRTRQAQSDDAVTATEWVEQQLRDLGFTTSRSSFSAQYCPNVVAEWRGAVEPDRYIIVGAHLDDRAQNIADPEVRAPGANDDGSGSGLVLELARVISSSNATFRYGVQIHTYCAEEQGLIGSRALAAEYADEGVDVIAMLQGTAEGAEVVDQAAWPGAHWPRPVSSRVGGRPPADMVGYQHGAEPELSFVNRYVDLDLMAFVQNVTATYLPDLATSETNACCSDHQSFLENGYASAGFVEAGGYTIDPQYHNTSTCPTFEAG